MLMMHADAYEAALKAARLEGRSRAVMAASELVTRELEIWVENGGTIPHALQRLELLILKLQYTEDTDT